MVVGHDAKCHFSYRTKQKYTSIYYILSQDEPEALCFCKETQAACGSDNRTYESVCQMNEASVKSGNTLYLKHWGPCHSGKMLEHSFLLF